MNTKRNKKIINVLLTILISLIHGVIVWTILNSLAFGHNVPKWIILCTAVWLNLSAIFEENFSIRSMILVPMITTSIGAIFGAILGYLSNETNVRECMFFTVAIMTVLIFVLFKFTANSWRFNPNIRNWKKIGKISDIKNPSELEILAIKAAKWWFSNIPNSTEQDIVNMIQDIVNGYNLFDSNDYLDSNGRPIFEKSTRMYVTKRSGIEIEEYQKKEIE